MSHLTHCHQPISVVLLSLPLPCHSKLISHMTFMSQVIDSKQPGHRTEHPRMADFTFGPFQYSSTTSKDPIPTDSLVHRLIRQTAVSVKREISHEPASPYQLVFTHVRNQSHAENHYRQACYHEKPDDDWMSEIQKWMSGQSKPSTYLQVFEFQSETSLTSVMMYGYLVQIRHWDTANYPLVNKMQVNGWLFSCVHEWWELDLPVPPDNGARWRLIEM